MGSKVLMDAFGFDEDDLIANRVGEITDSQRATLRATRSQRNDVWWGIFLTIGTFAATMYGILLLKGASLQEWLLISALVLPVLLISAAIRVGLGQVEVRTIRRGQLRSITGRASTRVELNNIVLAVGDKAFSVTPAQFRAIRENQLYTVYYLPYSDLIMSIEPETDPRMFNHDEEQEQLDGPAEIDDDNVPLDADYRTQRLRTE